MVIEVKDMAGEAAFLRVNVTPEEAAALPVVDGRISFDLDAAALMERLSTRCSHCFGDRGRPAGANDRWSYNFRTSPPIRSMAPNRMNIDSDSGRVAGDDGAS